MTDRIIIFGSSGHARSIAAILELLNYEIIGFIDSFLPKGIKVLDYKTLGDESVLKDCYKNYKSNKVVVGIGDIYKRRMVVNKIKLINSKIDFPNIISPKATVANYSNVGIGTIVHSNSFVNIECTIGNFSIINSSSTIEHNTIIGDYCNVSPGANIGGNVVIGNNTFIGSSATIFQKRIIGENTVIGAGSVVNMNIPDNVLAAGVPVTIKKKNYRNENIFK